MANRSKLLTGGMKILSVAAYDRSVSSTGVPCEFAGPTLAIARLVCRLTGQRSPSTGGSENAKEDGYGPTAGSEASR